MSTRVTKQAVLDALKQVIEPDLKRDLVSLGMIRRVEIEDGRVSFTVCLTTPACPLQAKIKRASEEAVMKVPGVRSVAVELNAEVPAAPVRSANVLLPTVKHLVAVASGKGGVGKSTVAVNLALALAESGARVGLMDADVYGPSIPTMMGLEQKSERVPSQKLAPLEAYGVRVMSIGFMRVLTSDGQPQTDTALIWRGPMVSKTIRTFLGGVAWGAIDYLLIDLPPGTGDAQLTLSQAVPLTGAVIVTTPQDVSLIDARKGINLFRKLHVPVLGIVENMSYFACPHCGERTEVFDHGGGERISRQFEVPFLGEVPLDPAIRMGGDQGVPVLKLKPGSPQSEAFRKIGQALAAQISIQTLAPTNPRGAAEAKVSRLTVV